MNHFFQETKIKKRRSFRDLVYNSLTRSKSKNNNNIYKAPDGGGVDASSRSCARADSTPAGCVEFDPLHAERDLDHFTPDSRRLIIIIAIQLSGGPAGARGRRRCPWTLCRRSSRPPPPGHPLDQQDHCQRKIYPACAELQDIPAVLNTGEAGGDAGGSGLGQDVF